MSEGSRPGGLTALAVINFVFGAFDLLGSFGAMMILFVADGSMPGQDDEAKRKSVEMIEKMGRDYWVLQIAGCLVLAALLIASGVGYLRQSGFWGRTLGNVYSVISIAVSGGSVYLLRDRIEGAFTLGLLIALIYPVLTLILINSTFKEDFVR